MQLFSIQKVTASSTYLSGIYITNYALVGGTEIVFEDNPGEVDLWNVPRRNQEIVTMNEGGVNIDFGIDRSKQEQTIKIPASTQSFYNKINNYYLNDVDQLYLIKSHKNENWVVKWKDLSPKYVATLPSEFKNSVPIPVGMDNNTPFKEYADIFELNMKFYVLDANVQL